MVKGTAPLVFLGYTSELAERLRPLTFPRSYVSAATRAAMRAGCAVTHMGDFPPRDMPPIEHCRGQVRAANVYVGILGQRYGSLVPDESVSYTEAEYREATALGMPRLMFLVEGQRLGRRGEESPTLVARQQRFRQEVANAGLVVATVRRPSDLQVALLHALLELRHSTPRRVPPVWLSASIAVVVPTLAFLGMGYAPAVADSSRLIDDPRAADPCALAEQAVEPLAQFGPVELDRHYGAFARCDAVVQPTDGSPTVDVKFELQQKGGAPSARHDDGGGGITVYHEDPGSRECDDLLMPRDPTVAIDVDAKRDSGGNAGLCRMADVAAHAALPVLRSGRQLRSRSFPPSSLANLDACGLLDAPSLASVDVTRSTPSAGFARWQCRWEAANGRWAAVMFDQNQLLTPGFDGDLRQFEGFDGFVQANGDDAGNDCVVRIEFRKFTADGDALTELVDVVLGGPEPAPATTWCDLAQSLAQDAAHKLAADQAPAR